MLAPQTPEDSHRLWHALFALPRLLSRGHARLPLICKSPERVSPTAAGGTFDDFQPRRNRQAARKSTTSANASSKS